jgi:geranylgeranyl reductase family protein
MFDAIVCGAGPAGAVAATVLARSGARVLLLDRAAFPRDKLCGDTLNPGAIALLHRLDLGGEVSPRALRIDGMLVTGERGAAVRCSYRGGIHGWALLRRDLDAALVRAAVAAGARLEERVLVRGPLLDRSSPAPRVRGVVLAGRDGRDIRVPAPTVIAADGGKSRIAHALGLVRLPARPQRWAVGAYFEGVADVGAFGEMHVRRGRYIGIAPVPSGRVNVCLVVPRGERLADPAAALIGALAADPRLRDRFTRARMTGPPAVLGPMAADVAIPGAPGLLLAGDAAGFIDPMTGDGLRFAIRGGELAAQAALGAFRSGTAPAHVGLAARRRREFGSKWRFNRLVRALVGHGAAVDAASLLASIAPPLLRRAVAYAGDLSRA